MWLTVAVSVTVGLALLGILGIMVLYTMAEHQERQDAKILPGSYLLCKPSSQGNTFARQIE